MTAKIIPFPKRETIEELLEKQLHALENAIQSVKENKTIFVQFIGELQHTLLLSQMLTAAIATRAGLLKIALDRKQSGD